MARDLNKVQMTGRLGADPEMRYTPQGHAVTTFRAASNRSWRTAEGETHEDTEVVPRGRLEQAGRNAISGSPKARACMSKAACKHVNGRIRKGKRATRPR